MNANQQDNQRSFTRPGILQSQGRPPIRSISQVYGQSHHTPVRQVSFDASTLRSLEPPAKRPKFEPGAFVQQLREHHAHPEVPETELQGTDTVNEAGRDGTSYKLPPFPSRPGAHLPRTQSPVHQYFQNKEPVSSKPYVLEIPKIAPRYANKEPTDCSPWTGDKTEDVLNENTIKNGYFDKSTAPQAESLSARPMIWGNVKHKSGLQSLSSLFVTTLQQRQMYGAVSLETTFKPPPRATLTEPKRETWLKDLADANISLRRLSRTIPHGIRGKTLLDQCMAKRVPFERAIWLVKCVGANEIRAFKRKGPNSHASGTEAKWVNEWTTNVEEFVSALVETPGSMDWKQNVEYGLHLVAHVYAERLIDKEYFLEWIIASLQSATAHRLPIWLLMTQMYWNEMPTYRKFGKKLAVALCEQATKLHGQVVEANQMLWDKLSGLTLKLFLTTPDCFTIPKLWNSYSTTIEAICGEHKEDFTRIRHRNEQLKTFACMSDIPDPMKQVIDILDDQHGLLDIKKLSKKCLSINSDMDLIATTLCLWATTMYRPGFSNTFLCLRLLRRWAKSELELESTIFSFIRSCSERMDLNKQKFFKLVSELVRSKHISISRFLQWIMAQGSPLPLERELLMNLPLHGLPDYAQNLWQMVLNRPLPVDTKLAEIQTMIKDRLFNDAMVDEDLDHRLALTLSLPEQYRLSHWIRGLLFSHADEDEQLASSDDLNTICRLLETMNDYAVLADALGIYAEIGDISLLPIVCDTINAHFDCLHAIGAAEGIYEVLLERMEEVPNRSPAQKPLIQSLVDIAARLPHRSKTLLVLQKELALCEPKSAIAACSPVSDTMGETQEDITFFEEIEILFGSGTSMDRPLLTRIFTDIVKRLETSWTDDILTSINLAEFLLRLRSFNREIFSTLMSTWIGTILTSRQDIKTLLAILICGSLVEVQELYTRLVQQTTDTAAMSNASIEELLDLLLETPNIPRSWHLQVQVDSTIQEDAKTLAQFLAMVVERSGQDVLIKPGLRDFVLKLAVQESAIPELFPIFKPTLLADLAIGLPAEPTFQQQLPDVLCYFNSALCAGKMKKSFQEYTGMDLSGLPEAIIAKVTQGNDCRLEPWKVIANALPLTILLDIHRLLMTSLLDSNTELVREAEEPLLRFLGILEENIDIQNLIGTVGLLSDNLSKVQSILFQPISPTTSSPETAQHHLKLILRLLGIHSKILSQAQITAQTAANLCLTLSNLYIHPQTSSNSDISASLVNTLTLLSDTITPEAREQIIHSLNAHNIPSTTLQFLFGPPAQATSDSDLELITTTSLAPETSTQDLGKDKSKPGTGSKSGKDIVSSQATPFALHRWEMVQDATPVIGDNDTSLSLALFGARKAVL